MEFEDGGPALEHDRFPPFGGLKAFFEVGRMGSAAKAAERLNVSASSVSHQLKALEKELGARLIDNRKGRLYLTPEGEAFYNDIRDAMITILNATDAVRSVPGRRRVSLTLTPSFAAHWLMPLLPALDRDHPDIELNLVTTTRVVDLDRENIDLAIRRGSGVWPGCITEPLIKETIVPVISPRLLDQFRSDGLTQALQSHRALVNTTVPNEWANWCAVRGLDPPAPQQCYNLETYELTIQAARDGLGIALGRHPLIDGLINTGDLISPFQIRDIGNISYYVVRNDTPMPSAVKRFHGWLTSKAT